jgi:hypothetical protein
VDKSRFETGHNINFNNTSTPDKAPGYVDHSIKEAIKIRLHPGNFNRGGGFNLSQSWYPLNDKAVPKHTNLETRPSLANL